MIAEYVNGAAVGSPTVTRLIRTVRCAASSGMVGGMFLVVIWVGWLSPASTFAGKPRTPKQAPLWRVDLRTIGYQGPLEELVLERGGDLVSPLWFLDDSTVLATFLTRHPAVSLSRRDCVDCSRSLRLNAFLFDARTGELQGELQWSVPNPGASVIAAHAGTFVVHIGARLMLYSSMLESLGSLELSLPPPGEAVFWIRHTSPTGKSVLLWDLSDKYIWVDATALESRYVSESYFYLSDHFGPSSISDDAYATGRNRYKPELWLREVEGSWARICAPPLNCDWPHFVNNEMLALQGAHEIILMKTDGRVLFSEKFGRKTWIRVHSGVFPSAGGRRFGVALTEKKGGSALLDIMPKFPLTRVMIFDIPTRSWVYNLNAKRLKMKRFDGISLSPDGSLLGILRDGVVEVYQLPDLEPESPVN